MRTALAGLAIVGAFAAGGVLTTITGGITEPGYVAPVSDPTPTVTVEASLPVLPDSCDVTFEGDEAGRYPCADNAVDSAREADGTVHEWCRVILTSDEDSYLICADGWSAES